MRKWKNRMLAGPYILWMIGFILIPLFMVVYNGLTNAQGEFTLENILEISKFSNYMPLLRSLGMSFVVTLTCLILGFPLAYILSKYSVNRNSLIVLIFIMPMWMNFILRTLAWRLLLLNNGMINHVLEAVGLSGMRLINTPFAVILGTAYDYFPFMVLPVYNALVKIDKDVIWAARDLGAKDMTVLRRIILPLSLPGIVSGITMVFVPAISEFVIADMLGGGKVYLIGNVIEQSFNSGYADYHLGSGLSLILMVFVFASMAVFHVFDKEEGGASIW